MKHDVIVLNKEKNVTLTTYLQSVGGELGYIPARPAVLIIPGGGYDFCSEREAEPVALAYLRAGYHAFILRYSCKGNKTWPAPLEDYEQAMSEIRSHASEWNVLSDKIAVIGFSAGGHLAASAATMSVNRPNAAILVYAVLNATSTKEWNESAPDPVSAVSDETCPCFLAASRTDSTVTVNNSLDFMQALYRYDITFESHIYSVSPHGFSLGDSTVQGSSLVYTPRLHNWVDDSIGWLREVFGDFGNGQLTKPLITKYALESHEEYLSVDCTVGQIRRVPEGAEYLSEILKTLTFPWQREELKDVSMSVKDSVMARFKCAEMLGLGGISAEKLEEINTRLKTIRQ